MGIHELELLLLGGLAFDQLTDDPQAVSPMRAGRLTGRLDGVVGMPLGQAQEAHHFIREWIGENFDVDTANLIRILYGGSVKPDNIKDLMSRPDIDGALVGGASLRAQSFIPIIRFGEQ